MAFDPQRLLDWRFEPIRHAYTERDAILYALGIGLPADPLDEGELAFLLEDRLQVLPTYGTTLAHPAMWIRTPQLEIDWVKVLHAAQATRFHRPLPPAGEVIGQTRVTALHDRGREKGATCLVERRVTDAASGALYCMVEQTIILRGNGGFGGEPTPRIEPPRPPDRAPDVVASVEVSPRAALIYRLSGDVNPLHADPAVALKAGFERPILHGLASYGIAGMLILKHFCGSAAVRLESLAVRFAGVVLPGDRIDFAFWQEGGRVLFEARVKGRTVLDQGLATVPAA